MKARRPGVWIACLSLLLVALAGVVEFRRAAPGPLSAVHQADPALADMVDCAACHGGLLSSLTDACLECHDPIVTQIGDSDGLHGSIPQGEAQRCAVCHSEHHGAGFSLVNRQSYALMGVEDPEKFNHVRVGFAMEGAHLELDCIKCHEHARDEVLPRGASRFLGLSQDCASCHDDPHEGRMVLDCTQCHGQEDFTALASLGHEHFLPLTGGHAEQDCTVCHLPDSKRDLTVVGELSQRPPARTCAACHGSPHETGFMDAVAQGSGAQAPAGGLAAWDARVAQGPSSADTGMGARRPRGLAVSAGETTLVTASVVPPSRLAASAAGAACVTCHEPDHESFRDERLDLTPDLHALSGFALDAPHDQAACSACHGESASAPFAQRYPGRKADDCAACHDNPHGDQFSTGPFAGEGCLACHAPGWFEPHTFGVEEHARAFLPLEGAHAEVSCETCHEEPWADAPREFHGTPNRCESCHLDAHDGSFDRVAASLPRKREGLCSRCHDSTSFSTLPEGFPHGPWTGFKLDGAHVQAACDSCHPRTDEPDVTGRTFGRAEDRFGPVEGCASCHTDPHEGGFDAPFLPARVEGATGCARCHQTTSFRSLVEPFDHRLWTEFPLNGAHGKSDCTECHAPLHRVWGAATAEERTWARAAGADCWSCHEDHHADQFAVAGVTECASCHRDSDSFSDLRFSHERDSVFSLGEAHQALECSACHQPEPVDGVDVIRYVGLPTECVDCHGIHESVLLRRAGLKR